MRMIPTFDLEVAVFRASGPAWCSAALCPFGPEGPDSAWSLWSPRLTALYHFNPNQRFDFFLAVGAGAGILKVEEEEGRNQLLIEAGPGFTLQLVGPWHLRGDLRWLGSFDDAFVDNHAEWTLGFDFRPELPPDLDQDGYKNKKDGCPEDAEDFDDFEDEDGCSEPDNDRDGLRDERDECPDEKEDVDDWEDDDGCPETDNDRDRIPDRLDHCPNKAEDYDQTDDEDGCPDNDNDGDGITDRKDACPDEAEDLDSWEDDDGCPEEDNDGDGFPDGSDLCPDHPEDLDNFDDGDGCPDRDNDDDRVPDVVDACPLDPEVYNQIEDQDGCPDETPPEILRFTGVVRGITFETGKAVIRSSSESVLQEALDVFERYPDLSLEIQGHTDDRGEAEANLSLSQARAEAVVAWFVTRGIDPLRFVAVGYGESQPIADNRSEKGRSENRRVEVRPLQP